MWVVKIGGSLAYAAELRAWLAALTLHGGGRVVIVPGGGPFADLVRRAQAHQGYTDASAHAMALLAMAQYGLMMAGIEGRLVAAAGLSQIREVLATGRVPVWIPGPDGAPGVRASWDVSSDSLALWVARQMAATDLALVKSRAPSPGVHRAPDLCTQGSLDAAFAGALAYSAVETWWLGRSDHRAIGPIVRGAARPATRIVSMRTEDR